MRMHGIYPGAWAGIPFPPVALRVADGFRRAYRVSFRSPWTRLTWLASAALFLVILLLAGVIDRLPVQVRYPFPPGTAKISWAKGYLVLVITPHVVLNLVAVQVGKAALLALAYGMNVTLAVARSSAGCCRPLALGSLGIFFGSLGLSFCCGPVVALIGALGLAPMAINLWGLSMGLLIISLLLQATKLRPEDGPPQRGE